MCFVFIFLNDQPFTPPSVVPPTMYFDKNRYTRMTGKIENAIAAYTCPMLNFRKSADLSCAIRIGRVFILSLCRIRAGVKQLFQELTKVKIACTAIAGFIRGRAMELNVRNSPEPSILAASIRERGSVDSMYCFI